jgi:DNA polymerase-3 subunit epsilon
VATLTTDAIQRSLEDLGTPLADVTFCVVDLEPTGLSASECAITEIGAVRFRGGERLGTFQSLIDPGSAIPPSITVLTGITSAMLIDAPRIAEVLPSFLEFLGDAVVVGHNVRFDLSFLNAALAETDRPRLSNRSIDTCGLARRLIREEVPDCRLGTLATRLRLEHQPSHRALDDALAAGDLLHLLIERAGSLGVTGLDDLLTLPTMAGHPQADKLRMTDSLPRSPGVYLFRGRRGEVLYVGRATNLRARVRSYFSTYTRRKTGQMLRETARIDHLACRSALEAALHDLRLIHSHEPRFNRHGNTWRRYAYVKLSLGERFPRLSAVRTLKDDGGLYIGPLASTSAARTVIDAIQSVVPLRRCTCRATRSPGTGPCVPAQLGLAACPCSGEVDEEQYARIVSRAVEGLTSRPDLLIDPLAVLMRELADQKRFEEAEEVRCRAAALAGALRRQHRLGRLRESGRLQVLSPGRGGAEFCDGLLVQAWRANAAGDPTLEFPPASGKRPVPGEPIPRDIADELNCVAAWLESESHLLRLEHCDGTLADPLTRIPTFRPLTDPHA